MPRKVFTSYMREKPSYLAYLDALEEQPSQPSKRARRESIGLDNTTNEQFRKNFRMTKGEMNMRLSYSVELVT